MLFETLIVAECYRKLTHYADCRDIFSSSSPVDEQILTDLADNIFSFMSTARLEIVKREREYHTQTSPARRTCCICDAPLRSRTYAWWARRRKHSCWVQYYCKRVQTYCRRSREAENDREAALSVRCHKSSRKFQKFNSGSAANDLFKILPVLNKWNFSLNCLDTKLNTVYLLHLVHVSVSLLSFAVCLFTGVLLSLALHWAVCRETSAAGASDISTILLLSWSCRQKHTYLRKNINVMI